MTSEQQLYWKCNKCDIFELVEEYEKKNGYQLGDKEPCIDCKDGTVTIELLDSGVMLNVKIPL